MILKEFVRIGFIALLFDNTNMTRIGHVPPVYELTKDGLAIVEKLQRVTYEDLLYYKNVSERLSTVNKNIGEREREIRNLKCEKENLEEQIIELNKIIVDKNKELANLGVK